MKKVPKIRRRQNSGFLIGSFVGFALVLLFFLPSQEKLHLRGPMNSGHEELSCGSCHKVAEGTIRQQIQANVRYQLGLRENPVDFGYQDVGNAVCFECHERPNDRHPVFRFVEPRFKEARKNIQPHLCLSCHLEHTDKRVTIEPTYCVNCHQDTSLKNDSISPSHEALIATDQWESCLRCHDFHGNHVYETPAVMTEGSSLKEILEYFEGAASPYSETKYYKAKQEGANE